MRTQIPCGTREFFASCCQRRCRKILLTFMSFLKCLVWWLQPFTHIHAFLMDVSSCFAEVSFLLISLLWLDNAVVRSIAPPLYNNIVIIMNDARAANRKTKLKSAKRKSPCAIREQRSWLSWVEKARNTSPLSFILIEDCIFSGRGISSTRRWQKIAVNHLFLKPP